MSEILFELVEFRVIMLLLPISIEAFQYSTVVMKHFKKFRTEGVGREKYVFRSISFGYCILYNLVQFHVLCLQVLYLQVGCDDNLIFLEHLNHIVGDAKKCAKRFLEGVETALQSFHHVHTIDTGQGLANVYSISVSVAVFGFQELDGTITGICKSLAFGVLFRLAIGELFQCFIETVAGIGIHAIFQFIRRQDVGEYYVLRFNVCIVVRVV